MIGGYCMPSIDLSRNETTATLALALEGRGFPANVCRLLAMYALAHEKIEQALTWQVDQI